MAIETAVILAGGLGTRLSELTDVVPKPMVHIGGLPILVHIMDSYARHGVKNFYVLAGYKSNVIKDYLLNFKPHTGDFTIDLKSGTVSPIGQGSAPRDWNISVIDTGLNTMTGGRIHAAKTALQGHENFYLTYGDGLSDIDFTKEANFHLAHGKVATVAAVNPPSRFGNLRLESDSVVAFSEKPEHNDTFINGGFFILNRKIFDYVKPDQCVFEKEPLELLAQQEQLQAFKHFGFWQCMDTVRDVELLRKMDEAGDRPWLTTQ
jgi:glucose-1-phosphate cytidylyltransferase